MRVLSLLMIITLSMSGLQAQQAPTVTLEETRGNVRSESSGPTSFQYNGYTLKYIFKKIDREYAFEIDNKKLRKQQFKLKVVGNLADKASIIDGINEQLAQKGYEVKETKRHPKVYAMGFESLGSCPLDNGTINSEHQVNSSWEGKCITVNRLIEKLNEWHPDIIVHVGTKGKERIPVVKLRKANFKDIQQQLADQSIALLVSDVLSLRKYITAYR